MANIIEIVHTEKTWDFVEELKTDHSILFGHLYKENHKARPMDASRTKQKMKTYPTQSQLCGFSTQQKQFISSSYCDM